LKYRILLIAFALFSAACSDNVDEELLLSREVSKQLGTQLKSKLVGTLQSDGPEAAIAVCNLEAIGITKEISNKNKLEVGRTALKIRNTSNQPDAWEIKQLKWFDAQNNLGAALKTLEAHEVVKEDGKKVFRYIKAIPMNEPCMLCHGTALAPAVEKTIKKLYTQDQATGFEIGQIRGAFTIKKSL
jgi:hypothetical protein